MQILIGNNVANTTELEILCDALKEKANNLQMAASLSNDSEFCKVAYHKQMQILLLLRKLTKM